MNAVKTILLLTLSLAAAGAFADAPQFEFQAPVRFDDPHAPAIMRDLAERVLPVYEEPDNDRYLTKLAALQLVDGDYEAANRSRQTLRERRRKIDAGGPPPRSAAIDLYAQARALEASARLPFAAAFKQAFEARVSKLDDHDAWTLATTLETPPAAFETALQQSFDRLRTRQRITQPEAVDLVETYLAAEAYRQFDALVPALYAREEARRYATGDDLLVKAYARGDLYVRVVRAKRAEGPQPALLEFNIDGSDRMAKASAAHDYIGVVAYLRPKRGAFVRLVPFEHDAAAVRAAIDWITRQSWSDGRVGMVGDGYSGFAAWAATKRHPPAALKAIATADPIAPGIDFPLSGRIYRNAAYRWATLNTTPGGDARGDDDAQWAALNRSWYTSGRRYRDLDVIDGKPNSVFRRWLDHPSYDGYWQKMIPYRNQFAHVDLPVLTVTGYYAGGGTGALYYFSEQTRVKPKADHSLLIGPWDDLAGANGLSPMLDGYPVDPVARIDVRELRYQWFDHVLKNAAKPEILKSRVNVQVMGSNQWRHAPSLAALANGSLRFYLSASESGPRLTQAKPAAETFVAQSIDFADRSDADRTLASDRVSATLPARYGISYVSEPLKQAIEFDGQLAGQLDFRPNKQDLDIDLTVYELLPDGRYLRLAEPCRFRASYAADRVHRHLLRAGERQRLTFTSERIIARRVQPGSRVIIVLGVNKRPDQELNLGTGKDVSEESITDARRPLTLRWYSGSYIDIPIRK